MNETIIRPLTLDKSWEYTLLKWRHIVDNGGSDGGLLAEFPYMGELEAECGLCEYYQYGHGGCDRCPAQQGEVSCYHRTASIFQQWLHASDDKKYEYSVQMLDMLTMEYTKFLKTHK